MRKDFVRKVNMFGQWTRVQILVLWKITRLLQYLMQRIMVHSTSGGASHKMLVYITNLYVGIGILVF
jgi:hypothetical protein